MAGEARCACDVEYPTSTCFDVEDDGSTEDSGDGDAPGRMRCAFRHCPCDRLWVPNEPEPMAALATHVQDATDDYVSRVTAGMPLYREDLRGAVAGALARCQNLFVLLLELDDARCTLARWLPALCEAAHPGSAVAVHRFRSRKQFMASVRAAHEAVACPDCSPVHVQHKQQQQQQQPDDSSSSSSGSPTGSAGKKTAARGRRRRPLRMPVLVVVSTHASTQGQVFTCTPSAIAAAHAFEEFMSVHDAVVALQAALGDSLAGVYLSCCYAMRLDSSHRSWPVDAAWLRDGTLEADVAGCANEVYYTGCQTADAHFVLASLQRACDNAARRPSQFRCLHELVNRAQVDLFPDLADEMGLCVLRGEARAGSYNPSDEYESHTHVEELLGADPAAHEHVHGPQRVGSALQVVFVATPASGTLARALAINLRSRSDIDVDAVTVAAESAHEVLVAAARAPRCARSLVVVVGALDPQSSRALALALATSLAALAPPRVYGVHFGSPAPRELLEGAAAALRCPVSAFVSGEQTAPCFYVPLLMYLVHLAAGENGAPLDSSSAAAAGQRSPTPSQQPQAWELEDVVRECRAVCPGLAQRAGLVLLQPRVAALSAPLAGDEQRLEIRTRKRRVDYKAIAGVSAAADEHEPSPPGARKRSRTGAAAAESTPSPSLADATEAAEHKREADDMDITLSANVRELRVPHMRVVLDVDFERRVIAGEATYTVDELRPGVAALVLDLSDVQVLSACAVEGGDADGDGERERPLDFAFDRVSVTVRRPEGCEAFPKRVRLRYTTSRAGRSLTWSASDFVYSCGSPLNNRSLLPCADAPTEQCTYEALVRVPAGCVAVLSAPCVAQRPAAGGRRAEFEFAMQTALPCSTIAMAAGRFVSADVAECAYPQCRVFATSERQLALAVAEVGAAVARFSRVIQRLLGRYPYSRYDVVVVPNSFAALGLQSPYVCFLAPCMLAGDGSMLQRLAHEMSHAYFGLLIAEADWNEVWLSEGFADYAAERVVLLADGADAQAQAHRSQLSALLRYRTLMSDVENTEEIFTVLKQPTQLVRRQQELAIVQRGLEPTFHQIPYQKGYFLLHHLAGLVGAEAFDAFLESYVDHFRDSLIAGRDMLEFFFSAHPAARAGRDDVDAICEDWLYSPDVARVIRDPARAPGVERNPLVQAVDRALDRVMQAESLLRERRAAEAERVVEAMAAPVRAAWSSEQLCLLLDRLVEVEPPVLHALCDALDRRLAFGSRNAEVRHRWCELVLRARYWPAYGEVERLLVEDRAMGLYVFGELLAGEQRERELARKVFRIVREEQDPQVKVKMRSMVIESRLFTAGP
eukprot:m51a1_g9120 hypothetical protein (1328) ;mRNA; r:136612-140946